MVQEHGYLRLHGFTPAPASLSHERTSLCLALCEGWPGPGVGAWVGGNGASYLAYVPHGPAGFNWTWVRADFSARRTYQLGGPSAGRKSPASSEASRSKGWFGGPQARLYIHKAVHTQGGAHKRRPVAIAGVLIFKGGAGAGPHIQQSEPKQGVVWQSTGKAAHT